VPPPLVHKFIDCSEGCDTGTGTFMNPYRNAYPITMQAKPGEYWHTRGIGRPDDASIIPMSDGTDADWITFGDWDGAPLLLPGPTGPQPVVTVDGRKRICIENLNIDATNSTTMDGGCIRGNGNGCSLIVVRKNHVKVHAGAYAVQFFMDPSHIWIEDNDLEAGDDVQYANSGDGISFGGVGIAHHCYAYRNRLKNFGHMGIQSLTQVSDRHNYAIYSGFNYISSTLAGGTAYLRTDDSLTVGNLYDGIATNDMSQSNSKEAIIVNGRRNRYYLNRMKNVHGPSVLFLMNSYGGIGQSCEYNDVAWNVMYNGSTYPLAVTCRTSTPDLDSILTMRGNDYRDNIHQRNMLNGTGGMWEGRIYQAWVTLGAAGYYLSPEELARWCPNGIGNILARQLAGLSISRNIWDGQSDRTGLLMMNVSNQEQANVNSQYVTARDLEEQFGVDAPENIDTDETFEESDPTDINWKLTLPVTMTGIK